jgi:hypothetical protein
MAWRVIAPEPDACAFPQLSRESKQMYIAAMPTDLGKWEIITLCFHPCICTGGSTSQYTHATKVPYQVKLGE